MQNYLVYRANTVEEIYECSYSLLKYLTVYNLKPPKDQKVVIYTSQPALLENYAPYFDQFELTDVQPTHTSRLGLIRNFFNQYQGNVLYLDTNTYCIAPLEPIFADIARGTTYVLKWNPAAQNSKLQRDKVLRSIQIEGQVFNFIPKELNKWNDSVIGLNSSMKNLLSEIVAQAQQQTVKLSMPVVEKWIFHHKMQDGNVRTAEQAIAQYDDLKEFRNLLRKFFTRHQEESVSNQLKLIHHIDASLIQQQKKAFNELPLIKKLLKRISGRHWKISQYEKHI
jgi:hypothetical protein